MRQWEYVRVVDDGASVWVSYIDPDKSDEQFDSTDYYKVIRDLGLEGWEAYAVFQDAGNINVENHFFKRLIE